MLKAIEEQWHQLCGFHPLMQKDRLPERSLSPLSTGGIKNLSRLDSQGASLAELCRRDCLTGPIRDWTDEMISILVNSTITISFRYR